MTTTTQCPVPRHAPAFSATGRHWHGRSAAAAINPAAGAPADREPQGLRAAHRTHKSTSSSLVPLAGLPLGPLVGLPLLPLGPLVGLPLPLGPPLAPLVPLAHPLLEGEHPELQGRQGLLERRKVHRQVRRLKDLWRLGGRLCDHWRLGGLGHWRLGGHCWATGGWAATGGAFASGSIGAGTTGWKATGRSAAGGPCMGAGVAATGEGRPNKQAGGALKAVWVGVAGGGTGGGGGTGEGS